MASITSRIRNPVGPFAAIQRGMTVEQIITLIGTPTRDRHPGTRVLEYDLADGSAVHVIYGTPEAIKIVHLTRDGSKMTWVPPQRI